jgi:eukaryotic-like serine/threonine-protein kinase
MHSGLETRGTATLTARDERLKSTVGGKYRIVRFLAEGGMGAVYEAHHLVVKRRFAVKFLRADLVRRRDVLLRFKREAEATGSLEGENIAAVVDFGITTDGAPYIVMEYLDGIDLGALLSELGPLPVARAADLVIQACRGMQEAHAAGVLHRDLKPQNLFVCRRSDGSDLLKIVDFGVAKLLLGDPTSQVTRTGSMVGTPSYMSPEQARGETNIDTKADVHALGVILYELLCGHTPHRGDSFNAVIHQIATQPPMPLRCEGREFPPELEAVVQRALASDPAARQASAEQLASELLPFARREVWPDRAEGRSRLSLAEDATLPAELANFAENARSFPGSPLETSVDAAMPARRRAQLVSMASLLAMALLLGILWLTTRSSPAVGPTHEAAAPRHGDSPVNARTPSVPSLTPPTAPSSTTPSPSVSSQASSRTNGRPSGRPPKSAAPSPAAPKRVVSDEVAASFDTQNPYE